MNTRGNNKRLEKSICSSVRSASSQPCVTAPQSLYHAASLYSLSTWHMPRNLIAVNTTWDESRPNNSHIDYLHPQTYIYQSWKFGEDRSSWFWELVSFKRKRISITINYSPISSGTDGPARRCPSRPSCCIQSSTPSTIKKRWSTVCCWQHLATVALHRRRSSLCTQNWAVRVWRPSSVYSLLITLDRPWRNNFRVWDNELPEFPHWSRVGYRPIEASMRKISTILTGV